LAICVGRTVDFSMGSPLSCCASSEVLGSCDAADSARACARPCSSSQLITPKDPSIYFSEHNWVIGSSVAKAVNPGAYFKLEFTGSSIVSLQLQPNGYQQTYFCSGQYMNIAYVINDEQMIQKAVYGDTTKINLASHLDTSSRYTLTVYIYNSNQELNRWDPAAPFLAGLFVEGVLLDARAVAQQPKLRPGRAIFFGDSITEGVNAQGENYDSRRDKGDWNLYSNSSTKTWVNAVAAAFDVEYSQIGFGSLGWTVPGGGDVPPFFTPGDDQNSSWNKIMAGAPRDFTGVDFVVVLHGTNDGLQGKPKEQVVESVRQWLWAIREVAGENLQIYLTVPFGQFCAEALDEGYMLYQKDHNKRFDCSDTRLFLIDLCDLAAVGLTKFVPEPGTLQSKDGIHPRGGNSFVARHGELGAMVATRMILERYCQTS